MFYVCEIIEAFEGTNHMDDVRVHQVRHDLNFMHLALDIIFVFKLLFLKWNGFYCVDVLFF